MSDRNDVHDFVDCASGFVGSATRSSLVARLDESEALMRERLGERDPRIGLILGSGLGPLADRIEDAVYVPFGEVPHMKQSTATSHVGRFVAGTLNGEAVIAMQGRLHGYEGNTAEEVAYPVWLMQRLGIDILITTNAAGAINESYQVGDFCLMTDHINLTGRNPLVGTEPDRLAPRFVSMMDAYDPALRRAAKAVAAERGIRVQEGVYLGLLGPSFETPAEIRAFRALGADTVAMSVVEEASRRAMWACGCWASRSCRTWPAASRARLPTMTRCSRLGASARLTSPRSSRVSFRSSKA